MSRDSGRILLITGNGKGKTTSAIGMIIRSLGWNGKVLFVQFMKGSRETGEMLFLETIKKNLTILSAPCPFSWETKNKDNDIKICNEIFEKVEKLMNEERFDLIVLDEINVVINLGYLDELRVEELLENRPNQTSIILTGRNASKKIILLSDTVSEINSLKHIFDENGSARKGIEF